MVPHPRDLSCLNQDSSSAGFALSALHWQAQGWYSQQPQYHPGKQSPWGATQQLSCWTIQGNANGLTQPALERKHFSTSWYSQTGLEVLISGLFDYFQFQSLLIIIVSWNYSKHFLFNFTPFQSFYYFSDSRWQGSLVISGRNIQKHIIKEMLLLRVENEAQQAKVSEKAIPSESVCCFMG